MTPWPGRPDPLGATWDGTGVNFALFSEHATAVEVCLFDASGTREQRMPLRERTDLVWHGYVPGLNADAKPVRFVLPDAHPGDAWERLIDTAVAPPPATPLRMAMAARPLLEGQSLQLLRACRRD
jgi:hypothetical protein